METKHSKGEWFACCLDAKPHFVFAGEGEKTVCAICHNDKKETNYEPMMEEVTVEECRANAKLIAAAPDLLDALLWAEKQFQILADKGLYPEHLLAENGGEGMMPIIKAIKKATE